MRIYTDKSEKNQPFLVIDGKIKTYEDFLEFKSSVNILLDEAKQENNPKLFLFLIDTYPINSYAIGYLMKLKENDGIDVTIYTDNMRTINLFRFLELDKKFQITIKEGKKK